MIDYVIAFDVDGTLRKYRGDDVIEPNERIRALAVILCSFKNVKVVAWSRRGGDYAEEVIRSIGLSKYIKRCYTKGDIEVDIAIDDQHIFDLGKVNLIVNEIVRLPKEPKPKEEKWL